MNDHRVCAKRAKVAHPASSFDLLPASFAGRRDLRESETRSAGAEKRFGRHSSTFTRKAAGKNEPTPSRKEESDVTRARPSQDERRVSKSLLKIACRSFGTKWKKESRLSASRYVRRRTFRCGSSFPFDTVSIKVPCRTAIVSSFYHPPRVRLGKQQKQHPDGRICARSSA